MVLRHRFDSSFSQPSILSLSFETVFFVSSFLDWFISVKMNALVLFVETNFLYGVLGGWFWVFYWVVTFGFYFFVIRFVPSKWILLSIPALLHWVCFFHNLYILLVFS